MAEAEDHRQAHAALSSSPRGEEEEIMMTRALEGLPHWRTSPSRSGDDEWSARRDQHDQDVADAISKRTRAHYSLADMSLDQLETFLQESDEEDYFQNVDDEEEYRKFLAAVQEKVGALEDNRMEKAIEESESEDEDADFEVEIEEALESDIEEGLDGVGRKRKRARRPVTREKRRKRESLVRAGLAKAPLRPLLPYAGHERSRFLAGGSAKKQPPFYGFTAHQIGQLYCLMHEHVQLLLQVHSMCILEPVMQQVAMDTRRMLMELVEKREAVLSWKRCAFPDFCFRPPYIHASVPEDQVSSFQNLSPETPEVVKSRDRASSPRVSSNSGSANAKTSALLDSKALHNECGSGLALSSSSAFSESLCLEWVPATSGPVRSLLDVAPLALVREFMRVVDQIVQASEQQDSPTGILTPDRLRVPLFLVQFHVSQIPKPACGRVKAHSFPDLKRTKAAAVVESSKKQSIALVPKDIAVAMKRFSPLFNKSLLPRSPPPATFANRLLFTDAEDELLAMGLMTYNNDWKAIQERFLPSKSMHQIFVRQKNRSSAKAPPNSIKAVRRMKSSPLTADEVVCIEEALKVYKYDWNKVCQYCVPHRDPATLPRQWRVALGTQKSYKSSVNSKEKRRLNDARRHEDFAATPQIYPTVGTGHSDPYEAGDGHCELENSELHGEFLGTSATSQPFSELPLASSPVRSSRALFKSSKHKAHRSPLTYTSSLKSIQTVKLAPGLPLLKLPPTVRVLSHSDTALSGIPSVRSSNVKVGSVNDSISGHLADQCK